MTGRDSALNTGSPAAGFGLALFALGCVVLGPFHPHAALGGFALLLGIACTFGWLVHSHIRSPAYHVPGLPRTGRGVSAIWNVATRVADAVDPAEAYGLAFEDVEFPAADDSTLRGWWLPPQKAAPKGGKAGKKAGKNAAPSGAALLFCHGATKDRRAFHRHAKVLCQSGHACLLFDFRGHGLSAGSSVDVDGVVTLDEPMSYGVLEAEDAVAAAQWCAKAHPELAIVMAGTSVGGLATICAATQCEHIRGVIVENPVADQAMQVEFCVYGLGYRSVLLGMVRPASPGAALQELVWEAVLRPMAALSHFLIMVFVYFRRFSARQLNNASGYKALQKKGWARTRAGGGEVPLLVLHCAEDQIVPVKQGRLVYDAAPEPKSWWAVPASSKPEDAREPHINQEDDANGYFYHTTQFDTHRTEYLQRVENVVSQVLRKAKEELKTEASSGSHGTVLQQAEQQQTLRSRKSAAGSLSRETIADPSTYL